MTVFISYASAQRAWVEALARNLRDAGIDEFIDRWSLIPGGNFLIELHQALERSRAAVVIVSPEAYHSGWVAEEITTLKAVHGPAFRIIPVIYGAIEGTLPFLAATQAIDFRSPVPYRAAFQRLLNGLAGTPPGPNPWYDGLLTEPPPINAATPPVQVEICKGILNRLEGGPLVAVLARDGVVPGRIAATLTAAAAEHYPPGAIRTLALPWLPAGEDPAPVYSQLGAEAGLGEGISSAGLFGEAFARQRRQQSRQLWLLIGFESLREDLQLWLANFVRRNAETYPQDFRVVLVGGEKLHELIYSNAELSILTSAQSVFWPDPAPDELYPPTPAGDDAAAARRAAVLALAGGHPGITRELRATAETGPPPDSGSLTGCQNLWSALNRLKRHPDAARLAVFASRTDLGLNSAYLPDRLLRQLYWRNLITAAPSRPLAWRSEALRQAVAAILNSLAAAR